MLILSRKPSEGVVLGMPDWSVAPEAGQEPSMIGGDQRDPGESAPDDRPVECRAEIAPLQRPGSRSGGRRRATSLRSRTTSAYSSLAIQSTPASAAARRRSRAEASSGKR